MKTHIPHPPEPGKLLEWNGKHLSACYKWTRPGNITNKPSCKNCIKKIAK